MDENLEWPLPGDILIWPSGLTERVEEITTIQYESVRYRAVIIEPGTLARSIKRDDEMYNELDPEELGMFRIIRGELGNLIYG